MISTKYLEMKYPSAQSLNSATRNSYSYGEIIKKEAEIVCTLNWELMFNSVLDYVNLYLDQGCLFANDEIVQTNLTYLPPRNSKAQ